VSFDLGEGIRRVIAERDTAVAKIAELRAFIDSYPGGLIGKKQLREVLG